MNDKFEGKPAWTLEQALEFLRKMQPFAWQYGYALSLAGSVLNKGFSNKDLDIVALPLHTKQRKNEVGLVELFEAELKCKGIDGAEQYHGDEASFMSTWDTLVIFENDNFQTRRVDLFIVKVDR